MGGSAPPKKKPRWGTARSHSLVGMFGGAELLSKKWKSHPMKKSSKVYVAGHGGLVGGAITRALEAGGWNNRVERRSGELDLREQAAVREFFASERPEYVFLAAAKVGGIKANADFPADFIRENLQMETNVIDAAWRNGTKKLLFLGSSCIYPKFAAQPIVESALMEGALEPTNEWYALAKIAGIKLCQAYRRQYGFNAISAMPTNLYGPGDNFHPEHSHVIPALMRRIHEARLHDEESVTIWGTGTPLREFLHVDDLADACVYLMEQYSGEEHVNVGTGQDLSIMDLTLLLADIVGYKGRIVTNPAMPDGTPRKLLDVSKLTDMGWTAKISFRQGLEQTYQWFCQQESVRGA